MPPRHARRSAALAAAAVLIGLLASGSAAAAGPAPTIAQEGCSNQQLLIGNQVSFRAEVYRVSSPDAPISVADRIWQSPPGAAAWFGEIKPVEYLGQPAILALTAYGAIVWSYADRTVLFRRSVTDLPGMNVHSALAMPDGNVLIADSSGRVGILYPGASIDDENQSTHATHWYQDKMSYAHALVYDPSTKHVYAGSYLTIHEFEYVGTGKQATLDEVATHDISKDYLRCARYGKCNEDTDWEDGIHDMYPVYGASAPLYFLSTGERTFLFDPALNPIPAGAARPAAVPAVLTPYEPFSEVDSARSRQEAPNAQRDQVVLKKGGIKSISGVLGSQVYCAVGHSAPWFTTSLNYPYKNQVLLYAQSDADRTDYDLTPNNHFHFDSKLGIAFYKARLMPAHALEGVNNIDFLLGNGSYVQFNILAGSVTAIGATPAKWNGISAEQARNISAALNYQSGKMYFFLNDGTYVRYDTARKIVDQQALATNRGWSGITAAQATRISATLRYPNGKVYFFLDNGNYLRFDIAQDKIDVGEVSTSANWKGISAEQSRNIAAAVVHPNGKAYFFLRDGTFLSYDIAADKVDGIGQAPIPGTWHGIGPADSTQISAALY